MHLDEVEMSFGINHVHTQFVLFVAIETPRRYPSSYQTGPNNLPCIVWCQACGFGIVPLYCGR